MLVFLLSLSGHKGTKNRNRERTGGEDLIPHSVVYPVTACYIHAFQIYRYHTSNEFGSGSRPVRSLYLAVR